MREMTEAGRSSVRVNGRAATAAYVREIGEAIAEIVGQHEAQRSALAVLPSRVARPFRRGTAMNARDAVAGAYARVEAATEALAALAQDERPRAGTLRRRVLHRARNRRGAAAAGRGGAPRRTAAVSRQHRADRHCTAVRTRGAARTTTTVRSRRLGAAAVALGSVERYDSALREMAQRAAALQAEAGELAAEIARAADATEFDPAELEAINARLAMLDRLERKYGCGIASSASARSGSVERSKSMKTAIARSPSIGRTRMAPRNASSRRPRRR